MQAQCVTVWSASRAKNGDNSSQCENQGQKSNICSWQLYILVKRPENVICESGIVSRHLQQLRITWMCPICGFINIGIHHISRSIISFLFCDVIFATFPFHSSATSHRAPRHSPTPCYWFCLALALATSKMKTQPPQTIIKNKIFA